MQATILIPTRNRLDSLEALLQSLSCMEDVPGGHEVLVINDGGVSVEELAVRFGARSVFQQTAGVAAARNLGAREARAGFLLFTDDDCLADPSWARLMCARLQREPHALVIGKVVNGLPANPWAVASQQLHDVVVEWFNGQPDQPGFFTGNNFAIRKDDWLAMGGMAEAWRVCGGEEREFVQRWAERGGKVVQEWSAVVRHCHQLSGSRFINQQFRYGRGAWYSARGRVQRFELYRRILTAAPDWPGRARLAASQLAVASGWAYEAISTLKHKRLCL